MVGGLITYCWLSLTISSYSKLDEKFLTHFRRTIFSCTKSHWNGCITHHGYGNFYAVFDKKLNNKSKWRHAKITNISCTLKCQHLCTKCYTICLQYDRMCVWYGVMCTNMRYMFVNILQMYNNFDLFSPKLQKWILQVWTYRHQLRLCQPKYKQKCI